MPKKPRHEKKQLTHDQTAESDRVDIIMARIRGDGADRSAKPEAPLEEASPDHSTEPRQHIPIAHNIGRCLIYPDTRAQTRMLDAMGKAIVSLSNTHPIEGAVRLRMPDTLYVPYISSAALHTLGELGQPADEMQAILSKAATAARNNRQRRLPAKVEGQLISSQPALGQPYSLLQSIKNHGIGADRDLLTQSLRTATRIPGLPISSKQDKTVGSIVMVESDHPLPTPVFEAVRDITAQTLTSGHSVILGAITLINPQDQPLTTLL